MASVPGLRGMRHIALRVRDIGRSKAFYRENFGMDVVWEPDSENVYLSSGTDNLALHATHESAAPPERQQLDHLGSGSARHAPHRTARARYRQVQSVLSRKFRHGRRVGAGFGERLSLIGHRQPRAARDSRERGSA